MENIYTENNTASRTMRSQMSYQKALSQYRSVHGLSRISWVTWGVVTGTIIIWCVTAYQFALATGAHNAYDIIAAVMNNAINIQDKDNNALSSVLIAFGAKDNDLILQGQYWRFVTPIFLHANLLHVGLNMLNLAVLGVFLERLVGHMRFLLIYVTTGIVSIIASFYFMPQEISVGASGAIFGLVGAYSVFVLMHRRAFRKGGIPALLWLIIVIVGNLSIGFFVPNVDNYAHLGGLLSGCLLGWWFTPLYTLTQDNTLIDKHSLSRRWPLALLTIAGTLILAIIARLFIGG
ncbi:MAG: rhomboid family intramembrane serine protease [Chloroflexi bacterium]|nr:MAG: rhomboid family intramembrane serine protease [Chloroflexota bacterium]TMC42217.1 MAG: rhomboid family intramembrane serine protease [Chloroflexota bacterium]